MDFRYVVEECTLSKMSYSTAPNSTWVQNGDRFPTELSSSLFLVFLGVPRVPKEADPKNNSTNRKFRPRAIQRCTRFGLIFTLREMRINYEFLWATCTSFFDGKHHSNVVVKCKFPLHFQIKIRQMNISY